jgi:hypothetical protein
MLQRAASASDAEIVKATNARKYAALNRCGSQSKSKWSIGSKENL